MSRNFSLVYFSSNLVSALPPIPSVLAYLSVGVDEKPCQDFLSDIMESGFFGLLEFRGPGNSGPAPGQPLTIQFPEYRISKILLVSPAWTLYIPRRLAMARVEALSSLKLLLISRPPWRNSMAGNSSPAVASHASQMSNLTRHLSTKRAAGRNPLVGATVPMLMTMSTAAEEACEEAGSIAHAGTAIEVTTGIAVRDATTMRTALATGLLAV